MRRKAMQRRRQAQLGTAWYSKGKAALRLAKARPWLGKAKQGIAQQRHSTAKRSFVLQGKAVAWQCLARRRQSNGKTTKMKTLKIKLTFTEEVLGTCSANPEVHREFIASKSPDAATIEDEVAAVGVEGVVEKTMTVFPKWEGQPFFYDYQIKGFFKDSCGALARVPDTRSNKLKAYKKVIDGLIFPKPRKIEIVLPEGETLGNCQRPLRAQTAQGERIALANSETIPVGSFILFEVLLMDDGHEKLVEEWLNYGRFKGLGQWRNSGKGRFEWTEQ